MREVAAVDMARGGAEMPPYFFEHHHADAARRLVDLPQPGGGDDAQLYSCPPTEHNRNFFVRGGSNVKEEENCSKKFVNPSFIKTIDLLLLRRLLDRHREHIRGLDLGLLDGDGKVARRALLEFFAGPEENYSEGLIADLHRIAELADQNGLEILLRRADGDGVMLVPAAETEGEGLHLNPKHLALRAFLDHPRVLDAASDILALAACQSLGEFGGCEEGIEAELTTTTRAAFERAMARLLEADSDGYRTAGSAGTATKAKSTASAVTHGTIVTTTQVIKDGAEQVISFRSAEHTVLGYQAETGRLKVGGAPKAQRPAIADIFVSTMLNRPDFFAGADSQNLYTLEPAEKKGFAFTLDCAFDPGIRRAAIVEVQIEKTTPAEGPSETRGPWTLTVRDRWNALARMEQLTKFISFGEDRYRISHIVISLGFDIGTGKPARLTVKLETTRFGGVPSATVRGPRARVLATQQALP